jgi:hypothetical protein
MPIHENLELSTMQFQITPKGALVCADCSYCGTTQYAHEWASWDFNESRDALQAGTYRCTDCGRNTDANRYYEATSKRYAARLSMPGFLDCTDWEYGTNARELRRRIRNMYGDAS